MTSNNDIRPYAVLFTRRFVSGLLEGLEHHDEVRFATMEGAQHYASFLNAHREKPVQPYANCSAYIAANVTIDGPYSQSWL